MEITWTKRPTHNYYAIVTYPDGTFRVYTGETEAEVRAHKVDPSETVYYCQRKQNV